MSIEEIVTLQTVKIKQTNEKIELRLKGFLFSNKFDCYDLTRKIAGSIRGNGSKHGWRLDLTKTGFIVGRRDCKIAHCKKGRKN